MQEMDTIEIKVHGEFDDNMLSSFTSSIKAVVEPSVIGLDIKSYGGYVYILDSMVQMIANKKKEGFVFVTNVDEYAYSCAFMLFLLGDMKNVSENASLMFHSAGIEVQDRLTAQDAKEIYDVLVQDDILTEKIILENTNLTPEMFSLLKKNTTFFERDDLINLGIMENEYSLN